MAYTRVIGGAGAGLLGLLIATAGACGDDTDEGGGGNGATTSAGATTPSTSTQQSSSSSTGSGPLPDCPGEYSTVPPGDCDLYLQDCDEGFGCDAVIPLGSTDYTTACLPDPGLKAVGEVCAMDDECLAGLRCIFGSCSPVCCQATGAPCGDGVCNVDRAYGSYYARYCSFLDLCTPFEPVATACTDQGTQCMVSDGYAVCIPPSKQPPLEPGDACEFLNECSHMNACINSICAWNCMLTGGDGLDPGLGGCPTAFTCTAYNSNIDNVGYCLADS